MEITQEQSLLQEKLLEQNKPKKIQVIRQKEIVEDRNTNQVDEEEQEKIFDVEKTYVREKEIVTPEKTLFRERELFTLEKTDVRERKLVSPEKTHIREKKLVSPEKTHFRERELFTPEKTDVRGRKLVFPEKTHVRERELFTPEKTHVRVRILYTAKQNQINSENDKRLIKETTRLELENKLKLWQDGLENAEEKEVEIVHIEHRDSKVDIRSRASTMDSLAENVASLESQYSQNQSLTHSAVASGTPSKKLVHEEVPVDYIFTKAVKNMHRGLPARGRPTKLISVSSLAHSNDRIKRRLRK